MTPIDELNAELVGLRRDRLEFLREVRRLTMNVAMHERRLKAERGKLHALGEVVCELDVEIGRLREEIALEENGGPCKC